MERIRKIVLLCLTAAWLGAVLGWAFQRPMSHTNRDEEIVRLSIPTNALNIGTVWEDERFKWTVPIENQETKPVEVASFSKTCNCLAIEPKSFVLEPGERRELRLEIDLTSQTKPTGDVNIYLRPILKKTGTGTEKRRTPEWTVKGQVRRVLALDRKVYLGRHSELSQPLPPRDVSIEVLAPLESLSAQCNLSSFTASVALPPNGEAKTVLRLTPKATLPLGAFQGTVSLKGVRKGDKPLPLRNLAFSGEIVADVEAVPPAVQVGGRRVGETFEKVVVLRSMTGQTLGAVRVEAEGDGLRVEAVEGGEGYRIRQKVCRVGWRTTQVHFQMESAGRPVSINVPVSYTGLKTR